MNLNGGYNVILMALLVLCQLFDFYSTWRVIRSGQGVEANPVMRWLMGRLGVNITLAITKLSVISAAVYLYLTGATGMLIVLVLAYVFIALNNWKVMHHG